MSKTKDWRDLKIEQINKPWWLVFFLSNNRAGIMTKINTAHRK